MANKAGMATGVEVARISVKVSPDSRQFRRELQRDLDAIENSVRAKIGVDPDMNGFRRKVNAGTKGLRTSVKVDADVDKGFFDRVTDKLRGIKGPGFGSGINPMGYAVIATGVLAAAAPLVGVITSALLALPGIVALIATPIAALTLGFDGVKKAAETLKTPFEELKTVMNNATAQQFLAPFEALKGIFPTLKATLPGVTQGVADLLQGVVDATTRPENLEKIENTITRIGDALTQAKPGVDGFTSGLIGLVDALSQKFPAVMDWFNNTGASFDKWVEKITRKDWFTGESLLDTAFGGLGETLKSIGEALTNIGGAGLEFMKDPENATKFAEAMTKVGDIITKIVDLSDKLYAADQKFRDFWSGVNENTIGGENHLSEGPDFSGWAEKMKAPFVTAWEWIKTTGATVWATLQGAASSAWSGVVNVVMGAVSSIQGVVANVGSFITGIWNGVVGAAQAAWSGVTGAVQSAWNSIISAVQTGVENVVSFVMSMGGRIISAITSIDLASAGRALMSGLLGGIKAGAQEVYDFVSGIAGKIADLKGPLPYDRKVLIPNGEALMEGLQTGMEGGLQSVLATAKDVAAQIQQAMTEGTDMSGMSLGTEELKQMLSALEEEKKRLKVEKNAIPKEDKAGREALQNQIDQLQAQKDLLSYQQDRIKNEEQYGAIAADDPLVDAAAGLMKAPVDFAKATAGQFMQDIGISGDGLISRAVTEGIQYIFQVGSVDEALSVKDREESKKALSVTGR